MSESINCVKPPRVSEPLAYVAKRIAEEARRGNNVVLLGTPKSGKTSILLNALYMLREWGVKAEYTTVYYECNLRDLKLVGCKDDNARVLLIDDLDLAFAMPRFAASLAKRIYGYDVIVASITKPVLIGHDLELIEPLIKALKNAVRVEIPVKALDKRHEARRTKAPLILSRFFGSSNSDFDVYVI